MEPDPNIFDAAPPEESAKESSRKQEFEDISLTELSAFTGEADYPKLWVPYLRGETWFAGFNYWAAILGISWFFYRKLYVKGLVSLVIQFGVPFLITLAVVFMFPDAVAIHGYVLGIGMLGGLLALGFWANVVFCHKAVRTIREVDKLNFDNELHLETIAGAGGVNFSAFFIAFIVDGLFWRLVAL